MSEALSGLRVLDLADRSAALAGRILADLGAEVILVEPPGGNSIRHQAPFLDDEATVEHSFAHLHLNANKQSVTLDLDAAADRDRFLDLVATADVVIDTERPGRFDDLALSHDHLRTVRPDLIQVSVTPYGLNSEWSDRTATDITAGASGGLVWLSGERRSTPVQGGANPSYTMAGLIAASATTIALTAARNAADWSGAHIDISLQEATAMAAMQTASPAQRTWHGRIPGRPGLSNALRCADGGYVGVLVRPDRFEQFLSWCDDVGIDHGMTAKDWEWARLSAPRANNPVAEATLALAAALTRDEFAAGALNADLVCLPVLDFNDMAGHEQYLVNEQFQTVTHNELGHELGFVRSPVDAIADGVTIVRAPLLGEHQALLDSLPPRADTPQTPAPARVAANPAQALAGIRVVDFGWVLAAPIGTRLLASFGAEVIRVESSKKPDSMRSQIGPTGEPDPNLGGLFNSVNAGKKSLTVDLTTTAGLELVKDLIGTADVVVNNFRPGSLERMGLGYDVLSSIKPDIVLLNLPGAHRKGPWAVRSSMGNILMAASGFNMLTGFPNERPRGVGVAYPDFTSPHLLVSTILAALRQRDLQGHGQQLHLSQLSGMVSLLGVEWMQFAATGQQPPRPANRDANYCPHGVFPAIPSEHSDDEWVAVAVGDDAQFGALCNLMGRPELTGDARFATHTARKANEDELDALVTAWTATADKWTLADQCQAAGIAAAAVEHLADMLEQDPQLKHHYQIVQQPTAPDIDIPINREAATWIGSEHRLTRSPLMGEHNEYVVREVLGRSEEQYIELLLADILG